jgi:hypothetical protein
MRNRTVVLSRNPSNLSLETHSCKKGTPKNKGLQNIFVYFAAQFVGLRLKELGGDWKQQAVCATVEIRGSVLFVEGPDRVDGQRFSQAGSDG